MDLSGCVPDTIMASELFLIKASEPKEMPAHLFPGPDTGLGGLQNVGCVL
jgi:hypothetical protein